MKNLPFFITLILTISTKCFSQNFYLNIVGSDSISQKQLNNLDTKTSFHNLKELQTEISEIKQFISQKGFFNAKYSGPNKQNDSTHLLTISLNNQYNHINIYYPKELSRKQLSKTLKNVSFKKNYFTIPTTTLKDNFISTIKHLTNNGKTFSSIQLQNIQIKKDSIFTELSINISNTNLLSDIKIKGYEKFPRKFIKYFSKLKKGKPLNLEEIEKKSTLLNNLRFVSELKKPEILFSKDSSIVFFYLKKHNVNSFDGFLGFSSNNESNKLDLNGNINLQLINNLNSGEEFHLKYQSTENKQQNINLKLLLPFIANTPISLEGQLNIFKKDSSFSNTQQSLKTLYQINNTIKTGIGINFSNSNSLKNISTTNKDFKKTAYLINLEHSKPNSNPLFSHKTKTLITFSTGSRTTTNKTNQQEIQLDTQYTFTLNNRNSIFLQNQSFYLISDAILENELHYIGGINSIRGFQENSIPSSQYSITKSEYRILLNQNLYLHSVTDYALTRNFNTNKLDNLLGFGIGFGLKTNNNLLRFVFANSKTKNENVKFSNSNIHLSLKTIF